MLPRYVVATEHGIRGNMPGQSYWHNTPDYRVHIKTNSSGIRADEETPYEKPAGVKRIVVLGDSFGMGYGVDIKDSLLTVMSNQLSVAGIKNEIINLSVSGFGTAEELIMLKEEGIKYQPDLVLLFWHSTDPDENLRSRLFKLEDGKILPDKNQYLPGVKIRETLFQYATYRWLAGNSHLYNWARERVALMVKKTLSPKKTNKKNSTNLDKGKKAKNEDKVSYKAGLSAMLLREINQVTTNSDASLLILDIPTRINRSKFKSSFPYKAIGNNQYTIVDPTPDFDSSRKNYPDKLLYWEQSHGHFTPEGCKIVGNLLARKILETDLLNRK